MHPQTHQDDDQQAALLRNDEVQLLTAGSDERGREHEEEDTHVVYPTSSSSSSTGDDMEDARSGPRRVSPSTLRTPPSNLDLVCVGDVPENTFDINLNAQRQRNYLLEDHYSTSAEMGIANYENISGPATPPAQQLQLHDLVQRAERDLARAWEAGLDLVVQMVAQEVRRLAFASSGAQRMVLMSVAETCVQYIHPQFELGIVLPPRWRQWLTVLEADSARVQHSSINDNEEGMDSDAASLMGFGPGKGRSPRRSRSHRRSAPSDRRTRQRSRRESDPTNPEHDHEEHHEEHFAAPPWRRPTSASDCTTTRTSQTRNLPRQHDQWRVLRANRHTWRCLIGLFDEGPGTDDATIQDRPLNETRAANIVATVEDMNYQQRLAFFGTFLRFLLELGQQVHELILTGESGPSSTTATCGDEFTSLMQTSMTQRIAAEQRLRVTLTNVQHNLEKIGKHKSQKAHLLQRRLHERYDNGLLKKPDAITEFEAVLLVVGQDYDPESAETHTCEDTEWVDTWWSRTVDTLRPVEEMTKPMPTPSTTIDLDTQETETGGPRDDESAHNLMLYEQAKEEEERELLALVEDFEKAEAARKQQDLDRRQLAEEMNRPQPKHRRLQVNVSVAAAGTSSTARFHTSVPDNNDAVTISFKLKVVNDTAAQPEEPDVTNLMQYGDSTSSGAGARTASDCLRRLRTLLSGINPDIRGRVIAKLRKLMLKELQHALLQGIQIVEILNSEQLGNDTQDHYSEVVNRMAQFIVSNLDLTEETELTEATEEGVIPLMQRMLATMSTTASSSSTPRRRPTSGPSTLPTMPTVCGTGDDIMSVVDNLTIATNNLFLSLPPEDQMESRRAMVLNLIDFAQNQASTTMAALLLLNYYLPQPNQLEEKGSCNRHGKEAAAHLAEALQMTFSSTRSRSLSTQPFNAEDVVDLMPALGPMVVEILNFMELGQIPDDDGDSTPEEPDANMEGGGTGGCGTDPNGTDSDRLQRDRANATRDDDRAQGVDTEGIVNSKGLTKGEGKTKAESKGTDQKKRKGSEAHVATDKMVKGKGRDHRRRRPESGLHRWMQLK